MGPIRYALGKWPVKFKRDDMGAAALFCAGNDYAVLDGPDRTEALGKLEFIGDLVVDVDTVAVIVENRSGQNMPYVVFAMNDGSHLFARVARCRSSAFAAAIFGWRDARVV